ncbi:SCO7613 C-terminal domain-containing membrane protein [Rhizomonospora bruguierae]|uniref:SCO7613 C-terminal domain-containing membrane protein n=1 Tax=Rhizomonospora bruguierae TaxID=1581705 RepID=UPI001BCAB626|nr:permease [Micromonospora sp. NBRC 107566]
MATTYPCTSCGRLVDPAEPCPYCGSEPPFEADVDRLDHAIAELNARDIAIQKERTELSRKLQAAMHQRALLAHAGEQRQRRAATERQQHTRRRHPADAPAGTKFAPTGAEEAPPRVPRQAQAPRDEQADIGVAPPPVEAPEAPDALAEHPEASQRSVQNIMLALGALLLGVAAVVFAAFAISELDSISRAAILIAATALTLFAPPAIAKRNLTATAETIAAVGLILVPIDGYALWTIGQLGINALPGTLFAGVVCILTAGIAATYATVTGLSVPRYATILALQPAIPLLAYEAIGGPTGWGLALTAVAAQNLGLGRFVGRATWPMPAGSAPLSAFWLRELTWLLHGVAVAAAVAFCGVGLARTGTPLAAASTAAVLLIVSVVAMVGAVSLRQRPLPDIAAGLLTLAVITSFGRVAALALPARSMLLIAAVTAVTALGVRSLPEWAKRGPQIASAIALVTIGVVVAAAAVHAAIAPVRAALPAWHADLSRYGETLTAAVGPAGWQLAASALLLTVAAALALPPEVRRESATVGVALTAAATPASLHLGWAVGPWLLAGAALAIGAAGLSAPTRRVAVVHVAAAGAVGLAAAGGAAATPSLTAGVLTVIAVGGMLIAATPRLAPAPATGPATAEPVVDWAAAGAAFAFPGAIAAAVVALSPRSATPTAVLTAAFLAACATLGYAGLRQVAERAIPVPLALGAGLGAIAVTLAAIPSGSLMDLAVGILLVAAATLVLLAPLMDRNLQPDRTLDGPDIATAAVTLAAIATLARIAIVAVPDGALATTALLLLLVALGVRAMPEQWRRGPALGVGAGGAVLIALAGYQALAAGLRALAAPGRLWASDLGAWPAAGTGWQAPVALVLLAIAATVALPPPWGYDVAAACAGLATVGAPVAFGLPWWSPLAVGGLVAAAYGVAAVAARDPRAATARVMLAATLALYAVGASLVRPWTTAVALTGVAVLGVVIAALAPTIVAPPPGEAVEPPPLPGHLTRIGGAALAGALLAVPGAGAALAAQRQFGADLVLTAALAGTALCLAVLATVRDRVPEYLPYGTVGVAGGATITALAALPSSGQVAVYAAAAVLLAVLAELIRATAPRGDLAAPAPAQRRLALPRWQISPTTGAVAASALPAAIAVAVVAPTLLTALVDPYQTLTRIWQGPPPALVHPAAEPGVSAAALVAALLLTITAALAAIGFGGGWKTLPVVLPSAALTLLIAPVALNRSWPAPTMAALTVFVISMLGLALVPPPPATGRARPLRASRHIVLAIGLAAGGAGLAGALATRSTTLITLGGAVAVGATAALAGRSPTARILGWLFAAQMGVAFAYTAGLVAGVGPHWSSLGVLAVAAVLIACAATLPRLRRDAAYRETAAVEWSGHAAALVALVLAMQSTRHVAALLAAWGAVLGLSATRANRRPAERRVLYWSAAACEVVAVWLLMRVADVALPEAYTLPFAAMALLIGLIELRQRPDLGSWAAYGPALVAAFLPITVLVLLTDTSPVRQVLLLLGAVATLIVGSMGRQRAPVVVGGLVTTIAALSLLRQVGPWLVLIPVGLVLLFLGANYEKRRQDLRRLRGRLNEMR